MTIKQHDYMTSSLPILEHLAELRRRCFIIVGIWLLLFIACAYFAGELYSLIAAPLIDKLPQGGALVAVDVASPFIAPLKLAAFISLFIAMPLAIQQIWYFVAPGLYVKEKRLVVYLLLSTMALFYLGVLFVYFILIPLTLDFFYRIAPEGVQIMTDINRYLNFILRLSIVFGLAFELPIAIFVLVRFGLVKLSTLRHNRRYIVVGCFIAAMLLTPPDIFSQVLLAIPMCLLYEVGILLSAWKVKSE